MGIIAKIRSCLGLSSQTTIEEGVKYAPTGNDFVTRAEMNEAIARAMASIPDRLRDPRVR